MKKLSKSIGAVILGATLVAASFTNPASAATNNSITVAEVTAGGGGVQTIQTPWINSGSISHHAMFRALFKADANLTTVKPDLASGYKFSKDGKTLTVTLKSGIKWSDGKDLTVDDVVWSMNSLLRVAKSNAIYVNAFKQIVGSEAVSGTNTTNMSGITTKGNDIIISLKAPINTMIPVLGQFMIMPKHSLADQDILKLDTNNFWKNPVVSGPYKVGTFSQGNFITLIPNDMYEGGKPKISEINIIVSANLVADAKSKLYPILYPADHQCTTRLDTAIPPQTEAEQRSLSNRMQINYRQVVGLWIWPMIKCPPGYFIPCIQTQSVSCESSQGTLRSYKIEFAIPSNDFRRWSLFLVRQTTYGSPGGCNADHIPGLISV